MFIATWPSHEDVFSIVLRQESLLSKAFNETHHRRSIDVIVSQYRKTLKQSIIDLHSLSYPIISFYVDHHIAHNIFHHQHITLEDTMHTMMIIASEFAQTCLRYVTPKNPVKTSLCGMIHIHNLHNMHSTNSLTIIQTIKVPHMFYIQLQFLEIVLVGGWERSECLSYQALRIFRYMSFPFVSTSKNLTLEYLFCGSHPSFTSIVPMNGVHLVAYFSIINRYASCKLRYSAIDILVSIKILTFYVIRSIKLFRIIMVTLYIF